jgi:hypothetical protein
VSKDFDISSHVNSKVKKESSLVVVAELTRLGGERDGFIRLKDFVMESESILLYTF